MVILFILVGIDIFLGLTGECLRYPAGVAYKGFRLGTDRVITTIVVAIGASIRALRVVMDRAFASGFGAALDVGVFGDCRYFIPT